MKTTTTTAAAVALLALAACGDATPSVDSPTTTPHVFEGLLAALDIGTPVGIYESWENIPDPDLAAEIRGYAEMTEAVIECGPQGCARPRPPTTIRFLEWRWSPPPDPSPVFEDPLGIYESWEKSMEWFDPIMRNGGGVKVEVGHADCMCGPIFVVEVTRTDAGGWSVGKVKQIGMVM